MRSFRRDSENLRDTRIAYTFLLSLALLCAILGIVATQLGGDLKQSRLQSYYESLTLCADALDAWSASESSEGRYEASVRFESAAALLPSEVELEPIMSLGDYMRMGQGAAARVRAFAQTFALLSSIDYTSEDEASRIIAQTLGGVSEAFDGMPTNAPEAQIQPPEVIAYSKKVAQRAIKTILGANAVSLEIELSDDGSLLVGETENLRMSFSSSDGSLEGFVYIRVGDNPSSSVSEEERLSAALAFYNSTRHGANSSDAKAVAETCGFTLCEIVDGDAVWHAAVDTHGRVWSLTKVKR